MKIENASLDGRRPDDRALAGAAAWLGWGTLAWYAGALLGAWVLPWLWRSLWRCALGEAGSTAASLDAADRQYSLASGFFLSPSTIRNVWTRWKEEADAAGGA